ncbi:MAG: type 1 glutamine amidotransferase domain-containing protein [Planctomycetaceae bacterium]|nr:type 1 glutamine amidotransferase [Planctomycetaceae bacterium]
MKVLILAADGVEDLELFYPLYRFKEQGFEVDVAGPKAGPITGKHGYTIEADLSFDDIDAEDYDMLFLPGGKGPETVRLSDKAVSVTRQMFEAGKCVAAICHGAQILVSAGVIEGKRATCWAGVRDDIRAAGANYRDEEVVIDGNLITSRQPDDLPAFCRAIFEMVGAESTAAASGRWSSSL